MENTAPVPTENALKKAIPFVSNAVVIGDKRQFLSCLMTLKVEFDNESDYLKKNGHCTTSWQWAC